MKLGPILKACGVSRQYFPNCVKLTEVDLYDGKDRIDQHDNIEFAHPLFINNGGSLIDLVTILNELEKKPPKKINIKIDENSVIFFYKTPQVKVLSRKKPFESVDFAD